MLAMPHLAGTVWAGRWRDPLVRFADATTFGRSDEFIVHELAQEVFLSGEFPQGLERCLRIHGCRRSTC